MTEYLLFVVFPYLATLLAVGGGLYRYYSDRFSYSSLSSQFLENRRLFWGSVPWHYGVVIVLLAHLLAVLFPGPWGNLVGSPARLYVVEITWMALGLLTVAGLVVLVVRRLTGPRVRAVTSAMDWILLAALLVQVSLGVHIAMNYRWGSIWFLYTAVPWLVSLATLKPQTQSIAALPLIVRVHFFTAFVVIGLFPLTRLVHLVTVPLSYLWRPYQVVIWFRRPSSRPDGSG